MFLFWAAIVFLLGWGMSTGTVMVQSGDASVGGTKAYVTSEFAIAMLMAVLTALVYSFFLAVAAGMTVIQDGQWRIEDLIHSTPLRAREYVWAKFSAVLAGSLVILCFHLATMALFNHVIPNAAAHEIRGPFLVANYLRPALVFSLPLIVFMAGISFAIGEWTRRPVVVFLLPVVVFLGEGFFLWEWSPNWLEPWMNRVLMWIDPSGFRWLNETWLKVDRGVNFYNQSRIPFDAEFLLSRLAWTGAGLFAVAASARHLAKSARGASVGRARNTLATPASKATPVDATAVRPAPLAALGMTAARPGLFAAAWQVARVELAELRSSPGLYLFVPLILLQTIVHALVEVGFLDTSLLITSGMIAVRSMGALTTCLCLLLLFYAVESLERERSTRLAAIAYATPIRTGSLFLGKSLALLTVAIAVVAATALGGIIALVVQQKVGIEWRPFLLVWGALVAPTILAWVALVIVVHSITLSRYSTYAVCLAVLCFTGYRLLTNQINWVGNWPMWSAVRWSDISVFELDRKAIVLSRLFAVSLAVFMIVFGLRAFRRREWDATRVVHLLSPRPLFRASWPLILWAIVPLMLGVWLALEVHSGREGDVAKKAEKDYWRKNLSTYLDAPIPDIKHVDLELDLYPEAGRYHAKGAYDLINVAEKPLEKILMSHGTHWEKSQWTMNGQAANPENRAGLLVFTPPSGSLAPGQIVRIGFEHEGSYPPGISKRAAGSEEFIVPSSVVLTSLKGSIVPLLGYVEQVGVDEENKHDGKEYRDDYYKGQTDSMLGARMPYTTKITVSGPEDFTLNSVGTKTKDTVNGGRRTVVWESEKPVKLFNVIAGRYQVERGQGTAVYFSSAHPYNVAEIRESLDAARRHFSEWFFPFPWSELKLTEFANLASYAQGFPTNITFSEGIGFLTKSDAQNHAAFEITTHEAAHQWWGNILTPGKGPGGQILSEGTAHFSTILLVEQIKGLNARIDLCKRLEAKYAKDRQVDSERPLVKIMGDKPGDTTVTYDKGGWVFWMLLNQMGRERALTGMRAFIKEYESSPDHPLLEDFLASMRKHAADAQEFDRFTRQWFYEVVVPEYRLKDANKTAAGTGWKVTASLENAGSGVMPVDVVATRGDRFTKDGAPAPDYREARAIVSPGKGETRDVQIYCDFEPDRVVVDPDARVLQLMRKNAVSKL
jgi:hypothetical protein